MSGREKLRALAEAASVPMTCGGHRSAGSLYRCVECNERANAHSDLRAAADPPTVLALLDELDAAEARLARVADVRDNWASCWCGPQQYPDEDPRVRDCPQHGSDDCRHMAEGIAKHLTAALDGTQ